MRLTHIDTLSAIRIDAMKYNTADLSKLFRIVYNDKIDDIIELRDMSIGCLLEVEGKKPSEIVNLIKKDLKIHSLESDSCALYGYWKKRLEEISKLFVDLERSVIIQMDYGAQWNTAASKIYVAPEVAFIDQVARRMNISWSEASKLKWVEVYFMMRIDKRQAYFDSLVQQSIKK